jgi:hypothetical protein
MHVCGDAQRRTGFSFRARSEVAFSATIATVANDESAKELSELDQELAESKEAEFTDDDRRRGFIGLEPRNTGHDNNLVLRYSNESTTLFSCWKYDLCTFEVQAHAICRRTRIRGRSVLLRATGMGRRSCLFGTAYAERKRVKQKRCYNQKCDAEIGCGVHCSFLYRHRSTCRSTHRC